MNIIIKTTDLFSPIINTDFKALKVNMYDWSNMTYFQKKDILKLFCKDFLSINYLEIESFEVCNEDFFTSFNKQCYQKYK